MVYKLINDKELSTCSHRFNKNYITLLSLSIQGLYVNILYVLIHGSGINTKQSETNSLNLLFEVDTDIWKSLKHLVLQPNAAL